MNPAAHLKHFLTNPWACLRLVVWPFLSVILIFQLTVWGINMAVENLAHPPKIKVQVNNFDPTDSLLTQQFNLLTALLKQSNRLEVNELSGSPIDTIEAYIKSKGLDAFIELKPAALCQSPIHSASVRYCLNIYYSSGNSKPISALTQILREFQQENWTKALTGQLELDANLFILNQQDIFNPFSHLQESLDLFADAILYFYLLCLSVFLLIALNYVSRQSRHLRSVLQRPVGSIALTSSSRLLVLFLGYALSILIFKQGTSLGHSFVALASLHLPIFQAFLYTLLLAVLSLPLAAVFKVFYFHTSDVSDVPHDH